MNRTRVAALLRELAEAIEEPTGAKDYKAAALKAEMPAPPQKPVVTDLVRHKARLALRRKGIPV